VAGLWENWRSPAGEWVRSFAVVTCPPNTLCAELHNRMPVVLPPENWPLWLGEEAADPRQLKALLAPYPAEGMTCWPTVELKGPDLSWDRGALFCAPASATGAVG
jgi:putative SOS response-associated peptidase YedK